MNYFYLIIIIAFSICLASCKTVDLMKEEEILIVINNNKEITVKPEISEGEKQKPIVSIKEDKKHIDL